MVSTHENPSSSCYILKLSGFTGVKRHKICVCCDFNGWKKFGGLNRQVSYFSKTSTHSYAALVPKNKLIWHEKLCITSQPHTSIHLPSFLPFYALFEIFGCGICETFVSQKEQKHFWSNKIYSKRILMTLQKNSLLVPKRG